VQGPCYSGHVWASDINILDIPRGDLSEISSSSYGLSLFSSMAGSHPNEGVGAVLGGSLSVSVGELWLGIDQLDEVSPEGTSTVSVQYRWRDPALHFRAIPQGSRELRDGSLRADRGIPGLSSAPLRGLCWGFCKELGRTDFNRRFWGHFALNDTFICQQAVFTINQYGSK
jgi:hypothetical protein